MPIPSVDVSITDGALGIIPDDTSADSAKIGVCSVGAANTLYTFRGSDTQAVIDELGYGPLTEAVVHHLNASGGKTVYAMPITASVAGANSAVTKSNGAGPTITLSGTPLDDYGAVITIVATGILGAGTFKVTLDGGDVYGPVITIPSGGTYVIPNTGITATFAAGTYTADNTYSWTSTAPGFTNANFSTAIDALIALQTTEWGFVHLVGQAANATDAATLATTMQSKLETATVSKRYARGLVEMPAVDKALLITGFASFEGARVGAVAGFLEMVSDVSGRVYKRSLGHSFAARLAKVPISVDAMRNDTDTNIQTLPNVIELVPQGSAASTGYHDEGVTPGLDAARFISAMTIPGVPGFFITNPNLMSAPGSDFRWLQYGRVMDRACDIVNLAANRYLSKRLRLNPSTGYILEGEAKGIEADINGQLRAGLTAPGHVTAAVVVVNRADNLLSDPTLRFSVRITPFPHAKTIEVELGFYNPALAA